MAFAFSMRSDYNNFRSTIYSCMAKQKLELNFKHGLFTGIIVTVCLLSVVMDKFFVSKETFKLKRIYVDGRIYKLCEDR
jgi:hypothetical protein